MAVVEAGLGGRYDATSVLDAPVTVLTNVGPRAHPLARSDREGHRRGEARGRAPARDARARRGARAGGARRGRAGGRRARARRIVRSHAASSPAPCPSAGARARSSGATSRSRALAARGLPATRRHRAATSSAVAQAAAATAVPGRLQVVGERPADGLRRRPQPHAMRALVRVAARAARRPAAGAGAGRARRQGRGEHARARCCRCASGLVHRAPGRRALSPAALQSLARQLGFDASGLRAAAARALEQAQRWAASARRRRGAGDRLGLPGRRAAGARLAARRRAGSAQGPASSER